MNIPVAIRPPVPAWGGPVAPIHTPSAQAAGYAMQVLHAAKLAGVETIGSDLAQTPAYRAWMAAERVSGPGPLADIADQRRALEAAQWLAGLLLTAMERVEGGVAGVDTEALDAELRGLADADAAAWERDAAEAV